MSNVDQEGGQDDIDQWGNGRHPEQALLLLPLIGISLCT